MRIFRDVPFAVFNLAGIAVNLTGFAILLLVPYYLSEVSGFSVGLGGFVLALSAIATMLASPAGGWLIGRFAANRMAFAGIALVGLSSIFVGLWGDTLVSGRCPRHSSSRVWELVCSGLLYEYGYRHPDGHRTRRCRQLGTTHPDNRCRVFGIVFDVGILRILDPPCGKWNGYECKLFSRFSVDVYCGRHMSIGVSLCDLRATVHLVRAPNRRNGNMDDGLIVNGKTLHPDMKAMLDVPTWGRRKPSPSNGRPGRPIARHCQTAPGRHEGRRS